MYFHQTSLVIDRNSSPIFHRLFYIVDINVVAKNRRRRNILFFNRSCGKTHKRSFWPAVFGKASLKYFAKPYLIKDSVFRSKNLCSKTILTTMSLIGNNHNIGTIRKQIKTLAFIFWKKLLDSRKNHTTPSRFQKLF